VNPQGFCGADVFGAVITGQRVGWRDAKDGQRMLKFARELFIVEVW
jgi:hypothetical protein